jgi:retron-type reverse transcriptase
VNREELVSKPKPFVISKQVVYDAYLKVKANKGAAGVDEESIEEFEKDLKGNLYKLWNRMSSGSYFPPPVRMVEIPKDGGRGVRVLGVPTVADRVAQTVVKTYLEPKVEPISTRTRTDIGQGNPLTMHWPWLGSDVGNATGCSTSTSKVSSTESTGNF